MFVTEEEARKKDCPMSFNRPVSDPSRDGEGMFTFDPPWPCRGSACMTWKPAIKARNGEVYIDHSMESHELTIKNNPDDGLIKGGVCGLSFWRR